MHMNKIHILFLTKSAALLKYSKSTVQVALKRQENPAGEERNLNLKNWTFSNLEIIKEILLQEQVEFLASDLVKQERPASQPERWTSCTITRSV